MGVQAKLVKESEKRLRQDHRFKKRDVGILLVWASACIFVLYTHQRLRTTPPNWPQRTDVRSVSKEKRASVVDGLWTLRRVAGDEGRRRYGNNYKSYEEFVTTYGEDLRVFSRCAAVDSPSAVFLVYHRLFLREFEASLSSVAAERLPAWRPSTADDALFADGRVAREVREWFGSVPGDAKRDFAVADGHFAMWPVRRDTRDIPAFVVRYGDCRNATKPRFSAAWNQATHARTLQDFVSKAYALHVQWHRAIGGCSARKPGDFDSSRASLNDPVFFFVHAAFDQLLDDFHHNFKGDFTQALWNMFKRQISPCLRTQSFHHRYRPFFLDAHNFKHLFNDADNQNYSFFVFNHTEASIDDRLRRATLPPPTTPVEAPAVNDSPLKRQPPLVHTNNSPPVGASTAKQQTAAPPHDDGKSANVANVAHLSNPHQPTVAKTATPSGGTSHVNRASPQPHQQQQRRRR